MPTHMLAVPKAQVSTCAFGTASNYTGSCNNNISSIEKRNLDTRSHINELISVPHFSDPSLAHRRPVPALGLGGGRSDCLPRKRPQFGRAARSATGLPTKGTKSVGLRYGQDLWSPKWSGCGCTCATDPDWTNGHVPRSQRPYRSERVDLPISPAKSDVTTKRFGLPFRL